MDDIFDYGLRLVGSLSCERTWAEGLALAVPCDAGSIIQSLFYGILLFVPVSVSGDCTVPGAQTICLACICMWGVSLVPFGIWLVISDFFQLKKSEGGQLDLEKADLTEMLNYVFHTDIRYSVFLSVTIVLVAILATVLLRKRLKKDWLFALFCLIIFPIVYFMAAYMASMADHFFVARHVVHGLGLLWLGIAIVIPRINLPAFCSVFLFMALMARAAYQGEYREAYGNIPYLADTEAFIAAYMEPGDIVIYNAEEKFDLLYGCYMPEQIFYHVTEISDMEFLTGKRVWFLQCNQTWFSEEVIGNHDISKESMGHYGFQIIENCTDFILLRLDIS